MPLIYYDLRITLAHTCDTSGRFITDPSSPLTLDDTNHLIGDAPRTRIGVIHLINEFIHENNIQICSAGIEKLTNQGLGCPEHIHFRFAVANYTLLDPVRNFKNYFKKHMPSMTGVSQWFLRSPEDIEDIDRWLRYPFKEKPLWDLTHFDAPPFENWDWEMHSQLATEERRDAILRNMRYAAKKNSKVSLADKIELYLDSGLKGKLITHQAVFNLLVSFQIDNSFKLNFDSVNGYAAAWLTKNHHLMLSELYALKYQYNNITLIQNATQNETP